MLAGFLDSCSLGGMVPAGMSWHLSAARPIRLLIAAERTLHMLRRVSCCKGTLQVQRCVLSFHVGSGARTFEFNQDRPTFELLF
jgi:hypothetical protein